MLHASQRTASRVSDSPVFSPPERLDRWRVLRKAIGRVRQGVLSAKAFWDSEQTRAWRANPRVKLLGRALQACVMLAVLAYLAGRLTQIGWSEVIASLPKQVSFYALFILGYVSIPIAEVLIYSSLWGRSLWNSSWAFVVKRAYNFGVFDMSGEAYFGVWANRRLGLPARTVLATLKDVNLLSAASSNLATPIFLVALLLFAQDGPQALGLAPQALGWGFAGVSAVAVATLVAGAFQRRILSVDAHRASTTFYLHSVRFVVSSVLQALQWAVVFPEAGFEIWLWFLAVQMALSRIPVLPNRDLIFVGLSVSLAHSVQAPEAAVAAMFVMSAALMQITNMTVIAIETGLRALRPRAPGGVDA